MSDYRVVYERLGRRGIAMFGEKKSAEQWSERNRLWDSYVQQRRLGRRPIRKTVNGEQVESSRVESSWKGSRQ